jgi:hypothetical protein
MGMMRGGEKAKNFKETMKNLLDYLSPYLKSIIIVMYNWRSAVTVFSL